MSAFAMEVAIVGGGIVGQILALSLLKRGIKAQVYEQAANFENIGAGIGIPRSAQECMQMLSPDMFASMDRVAGPPWNAFLTMMDGLHDHSTPEDPEHEQVWLSTGDGHHLSFRPCHRASLMADLYDMLPTGSFHLRKRLLTYRDDPATGRLLLSFADGSEAVADAVIGCDGIKSRVRQILFGADSPVSRPSYSHKFVYRAVVPMERMIAAIGERLAKSAAHRAGPGGHLVMYPVANNALVNLVMYRTDPSDWPDTDHLTLPGERAECVDFYKGWNPLVRKILSAMGDDLDRWGIFDMAEHPAPYFNKGRVLLIGDAAHAATPHHGCGAAFGIEDVLALVTALEEVTADLNASTDHSQEHVNRCLVAAFQSFNTVRYERDVWLVQSAREAGDVYEMIGPDGDNGIKAAEDIRQRNKIIYDYDVANMAEQMKREYRKALQATTTT